MIIAYEELREKYRPPKVNLLLIAEAPPSANSPRFFYNNEFIHPDSLYLEIMSVLFFGLYQGENGERDKNTTLKLKNNKELYLKNFQEKGFWLQDAMPISIEGKNFDKAWKDNFGKLVKLFEKYNIKNCILIKENVYTLRGNLEKVGIRVLNTQGLPFPGSSHQPIFRKEFGKILMQNGYNLPLKDIRI